MVTQTTLLQFWDSNPPSYIDTLLETVSKKHPDLHYQLFNDVSAKQYIRKHFGAEYEALYDSCLIPAMRCDFFRYCFLFIQGGFYVDADYECLKPIHDLLDGDNNGVLYERSKGLCNGMLYVKKAGDPLMDKVLKLAANNIKRQSAKNVWGVTGPHIFRKLQNHSQHKHLFDGFHFIQEAEFTSYFKAVPWLPYKKTETHWKVAKDKGINIFKNG